MAFVGNECRRADQAARWRLALIITGAVIVALTLLVVLFDGNWIKGPIERRVADATGREFSIGDLDIDLGLRTKIRARDIHLGNARWSRKPEMASAATVEMSISLPTLLRGRIDLPYVSLDKPRVLIERDAQGRGNWQFKRQDQPPEAKRESQPPLIRDLFVRDGELKFHEVKSGTDLRLTLRSLEPDARNERAPLLARGKGTFRDFPFELEGRIDSPLELQDSDEPFNVDLRVSAGETKARAKGARAHRSSSMHSGYDWSFLAKISATCGCWLDCRCPTRRRIAEWRGSAPTRLRAVWPITISRATSATATCPAMSRSTLRDERPR